MCVCITSVLWTLYIIHMLHVTALHFDKHSRLPSNAVCDTLNLGNDKTSKQFVWT